MANRDTENFRSSVQQINTNSDQVAQAFATIGQKLIAEGQEAKITENFSKAQLDLQKLNQNYQLKYEGNPFGGLDDLKKDRAAIFEQYGNEISPLFRKGWQDSVRGLAVKDDATTEAWGYSQTKKNTVVSINTSIKNNMSQAALDGQNFGNSDQDEVGSLLNYSESKKKLMGFGDKHLGATTTTALLEDYDGDYLKSFISGVSEANPLKALRMMDKPEVAASFKRKDEYLKMKKAVEDRALNVDKVNGEKEILGVLKDENSMLTKSLTDTVPYADLQKEFTRTNMSPAAQSFFMKANGYASREGKLTQSEQLKGKADLYSDMTQLMSQEKMTSKDVAGFQERIYKAMDNGTLNEKEGATYLNQLVAPLVNQKEESFKNFSQDSWISPDVGFGGVEEIFKRDIEIGNPEGVHGKVGVVTQGINNANKVKLYDYYMTSLQSQAESYGVQLADIKNLNKPQQRKLYADAQAEAVRLFHVDQNPSLSTLTDLPNQTYSKGKLIQGASGTRNIKPDVAVPAKFETYAGSDGYIYRKYSDGKYERVGSMPKGQK